jgi:hypothetical protein
MGAGSADISEIARAVACRNVHAAAQRDCKMREIAANTNTLFVALRCSSVASCMVIAESDAIMHVIAYGLHALPSGGDRPE